MLKEEYDNKESYYACHQLICSSTVSVNAEGEIYEYFMYFPFKNKIGIVIGKKKYYRTKPFTSFHIDSQSEVTVKFIEVNIDDVEEKISKFISRVTNMAVFI
jgi:hypothetical protein